MKVGERRFIRDYFDLAGNACASLYDNVLALTSVSFLNDGTDSMLTSICHDGLPQQPATAAGARPLQPVPSNHLATCTVCCQQDVGEHQVVLLGLHASALPVVEAVSINFSEP